MPGIALRRKNKGIQLIVRAYGRLEPLEELRNSAVDRDTVVLRDRDEHVSVLPNGRKIVAAFTVGLGHKYTI